MADSTPNKPNETDQAERIQHLKTEFLTFFRELPLQKLAAAYVGRSEDAIVRWKKQDVDFAYQIDRAKAEWARKNVKEVRSKEWLLERIMRDDFAEKKILAGDDTSPIQIHIIEDGEMQRTVSSVTTTAPVQTAPAIPADQIELPMPLPAVDAAPIPHIPEAAPEPIKAEDVVLTFEPIEAFIEDEDD